MTAQVWRTAGQLAEVWRSSAEVQQYLAGARGPISRWVGTDAERMAAQPLCIVVFLSEDTAYGQGAGPQEWRDKALRIANGYIATVEWLRSRLSGYPFPNAPQLAPASLWTTFNLSMQVPWLADRRAWQLQHQPQPPMMPFLPDRQAQAAAAANLGAAIVSSAAAANVHKTWNALTADDKRLLEAAATEIQSAPYPGSGNARDMGFRQLAWSEYILDEALRSLNGSARNFTDALADADRLIQQAAALFSQLVMTGQIRKIPHIGYVDQLDGPDAWQVVRSESYPLEPVRILEIVAFDHPYPRGLMLVEGTTGRLPIQPYPGSVTVRGRTLDDSDEIAKSAIQMRSVFYAPDER